MKIIRLTVVAVLFLVGSANAQFFVGGNLGFNTKASKVKTSGVETKDPSSLSFNFNAEVGNQFMDKLSAGVQVGFGMKKDNDRQTVATINRSHSLFITPFADYTLISFGKFNILAEVKLPFVFGGSSQELGNKKTDGPSSFYFGLSAAPLLTYNLNEHFVLMTSLNFMAFNFGSSRNKLEVSGVTTTSTETSFNIGAGSSNILNVGAVTIGARYMF